MGLQNKFEKLYHYLPLLIQNLGITLFGLYWYNRRFGGVFKSEVEECKKREYYSKKDWENYQTNILRSLLIHSSKNVSYYKELFEKLRLDQADFKKFEISDLKKIPFLEKQVFRELGGNKLLSKELESNSEFFYSSGSTGTPTKTLYSLQMHQKYYAIFETRINNWAGLDCKVPRGVIGGRRILKDSDLIGPFYRYNYIERQTYFSAYHVSNKTVNDFLKGMVKNKVEYMTGYASANYFLANFIKQNGLKAPKLRAVLTSSEKLTEEMRQLFREVYGCETFDSYNGVECCNLISECEHHKLHIVPDVGIVEIINKNGEECKPGEFGEIISTGLLNFNQPLIRYRMGDYVRLSENQTCKCGRNMPIVDEIIGRIEDTIIGVDGREMVRFHGIFINIPEIIESQIVQNTRTNFEIRLITKDSLLSNSSKELIIKRMKSQLGEINVEISIVNNIPRSANGKFKAVVSKVTKNL